ncbi:hypothetical protein V1512DRAFT_250109 [Lipomyces arxii]|uniref:uncharacterized protein n=1 Tax=Lipomyces arxii TaxID=56418 RepID=UPI0034CD78A4
MDPPKLSRFQKYLYLANSGYIRSIWLRWKMLRRVPFRKRFLIGTDLEGNTFWEWNNLNNPGRQRRLVELRNGKTEYVDYSLPPQWGQWLRHVRYEPPTVQELMNENVRRAGIAARVAAAEQRWKSIPLKDRPVEHNSVSPQGMPGADMLDTNKSRPASHQHSAVGSEFQPSNWTRKPAQRS